MTMRCHLTTREIHLYVRHKLTADKDMVTEEHLADCDICAERVRSARRFKAAWRLLETEKQPSALRAIKLQARLLKALNSVDQGAKEHPAARRWLENVSSRIASLWVLMRREIRIAAAVPLSISAPMSHRRVYVFDGIAEDEKTQGLRALLGEGQELLAKGEIPEATRCLEEAAEIDARATDTAVSVICRGTRTIAQLEISAQSATVNVFCYPDESGAYPSLVALISDDKTMDVQLSLPRRVSGSEYRVAGFSNIPDGSYVVELGPPAQGQAQET